MLAWPLTPIHAPMPSPPYRSTRRDATGSPRGRRIPRASKLLICGLFQEGRVLAQDGVGSCRRELLEHVVVLGACHLIRLVRAYISYYHEDRCHLGLNKDTPSLRTVTHRTVSYGESRRTAASRWTAPSIRVARGSLSQLGRSRYSAGRREVRPQNLPSRADHALKHGLQGGPDLDPVPD